MQRTDHTWLDTFHVHVPVRARVKGQVYDMGFCVLTEELPKDEPVDLAHRAWIISFIHMKQMLAACGIEFGAK